MAIAEGTYRDSPNFTTITFRPRRLYSSFEYDEPFTFAPTYRTTRLAISYCMLDILPIHKIKSHTGRKASWRGTLAALRSSGRCRVAQCTRTHGDFNRQHGPMPRHWSEIQGILWMMRTTRPLPCEFIWLLKVEKDLVFSQRNVLDALWHRHAALFGIRAKNII